MHTDIKALEQVPVEAEVTVDAVGRSCRFTWTGTTRDTLWPRYAEDER
jgi:hypothetical protein